MLKTILKRAGLGALGGIAVNNLISACSGSEGFLASAYLERIGNYRAAMLLELLLVALFGAICMAGTVLYEAERLPLAAATAIHCGLCIVPFAPLALFLGWCSAPGELLIMLGIQVLAFFLIWLVLWLFFRKQVKEINEQLEQRNRKG